MLRKIGIACAFAAVLAACDKKESTVPGPADISEKYVNVKDGLNVRLTPKLDGLKIGTLANGTKVTVLETKTEVFKVGEIHGHWTKVSDGKIQGWAFGGFLTGTPPVTGTGSNCGALNQKLESCMEKCLKRYENEADTSISLARQLCEEGLDGPNNCKSAVAELSACRQAGK